MNKKTATALSLSAVLGVSAAVGAGTFALFNDTESSTTQTLASGTIDLNDSDSVTAASRPVGGIAPGWTGSDTITFTNAGSLAGTLDVVFKITEGSTGCTSAEKVAEKLDPAATACAANLGAQTLVKVSDGDADTTDDYSGSVADLAKHTFAGDSIASATGSRVFTFSYDFPGTATNEAQSDNFTIEATATLTSLTS